MVLNAAWSGSRDFSDRPCIWVAGTGSCSGARGRWRRWRGRGMARHPGGAAPEGSRVCLTAWGSVRRALQRDTRRPRGGRFCVKSLVARTARPAGVAGAVAATPAVWGSNGGPRMVAWLVRAGPGVGWRRCGMPARRGEVVQGPGAQGPLRPRTVRRVTRSGVEPDSTDALVRPPAKSGQAEPAGWADAHYAHGPAAQRLASGRPSKRRRPRSGLGLPKAAPGRRYSLGVTLAGAIEGHPYTDTRATRAPSKSHCRF
jgi:hypothetical protein